jgi:hypothetical protein
MITEWWNEKDMEGSGRDLSEKYYPGIRLEGLNETRINCVPA